MNTSGKTRGEGGLIVNQQFSDSVRSDLRCGRRIDTKVPYIQVQSILQDLRQGVLSWWQRSAQRKPIDVRRHFPALDRNLVAVLRQFLSELAPDGLQQSLVPLDLGAHQGDLRP